MQQFLDLGELYVAISGLGLERLQTSQTNHEKAARSEIHANLLQNCSKMVPKLYLEHFPREVPPRSAPGRSTAFGVPGPWVLFRSKMSPRVDFGTAPGIQDGSKIALHRCLGPLLALPKASDPQNGAPELLQTTK